MKYFLFIFLLLPACIVNLTQEQSSQQLQAIKNYCEDFCVKQNKANSYIVSLTFSNCSCVYKND